MTLRVFAAFSLFIGLVLHGCGNSKPGTGEVERWDSAGISTVSNPELDLPEWSIDTIPLVDIGSAEGLDGQDLALPWSSTRLPDGRIAISNGQSNELRFYSPDGRFIRSVGREGEGPGEFRVIAGLEPGRADTIIVADAVLPRLTLFSTDGEFGRIVRLETLEGRNPRLRGLLSDSIALFRVRLYERSGGRSRAVRDTLLLATRPLDGGPTTFLGRFQEREMFNQVLPNGSVAAWNLPFARGAFTAVAGGRVWVGVSDSYELKGFGADGKLELLVRVDRKVVPVGEAEKDRFFQHQLKGVQNDDERRSYENVHRIIDFPETLPAFSGMQGDNEGFIWVRDYAFPWEQGRPEWRIFDPTGRAVAKAQTPQGLSIQEIGSDYVMGLWLDPMDVEHIRLYRLTRGAS